MSSIIPEGWGSTYLNPRIETYSDLVYRVKTLLGWPNSNIELSDAAFATFIDEAVENWTQWEGNRKLEYLIFCSNLYQNGCGVKLDELLPVGCNPQYCYTETVVETVTSTQNICDIIETTTAYLSVTPYIYPGVYNPLNPNSVAFSGISGQFFHLYFDPENPWDADNVCEADCVTINPLSSRWYLLSSNPCLSGTVFNFIDDSSISSLASAISGDIIGEYPLSAVPLTALDSGLSAIPISYYPLSCFYPLNINFGPPVSACINIANGHGFIYPNCDTSKINPCSALSAQYGISPTFCHILTSISISSVTVETSSTSFSSISSFFERYCGGCTCNCNYLSTYNSESSAFTFDLYKNVISGCDGTVWDLSATDISGATHVQLFNIPRCTSDGSIPLDSNDGIVGTFTLCNSGLNTNGPMYIKKAQFFQDFKPPVEILYDQRCDWDNNGFTINYYNPFHSDCVRTTPDRVPVDVSFCKNQVITNIGTVSSVLSSNIDTGINRRRKVLGVFSVDAGSQAGYGGYGGDLLFNFDYALMANTFGYDLQGGRSANWRNGYDLLTYHMAKSFVEQSRRMLRYVSYIFDPKTQFLKVTPEPSWNSMGTSTQCGNCDDMNNGRQCWIVGLYTEPPIEQVLNEYWIKEWVLARAQYTLAKIRGKFQNIQLYGGVTIAGDALATEAKDTMDRLLKELRQDNYYTEPAMFFCA